MLTCTKKTWPADLDMFSNDANAFKPIQELQHTHV